MNKRIRMRLLLILGVTALSVFLFAGFPPSLAKMREKINLGLDLRGGTHLVLQVVTDDAIRLNTDQSIESFRSLLGEKNITVRQITRVADNEFRAIGIDPNKDADARRILTDSFPDWELVSTSGEVPNTYTVRLKANVAQAMRDQAVDQALQTIRNRVDELGVAEPTLQKHGGPGQYEILVQLPGMTDSSRVKNIIKSTALLQLKLVENGPYSSQAEAAQSFGGAVPG